MTDATVRRSLEEDLLARAVEDWVHPSELLNISRATGATDPVDLRDLAIGLIARLLVEGLIVVGDVWEVHVPWGGSPGEITERIAREWAAQVDPYVMPGELFWIDTTEAGQRRGEAVLRREAQAAG